jgi:hypothetical protein
MKIVAKLKIDSLDEILEKRGMQNGGEVQQFIDMECIKKMKPYTPNLNGKLIDSATRHTIIGSGKIVQGGLDSPQARYLYYGMLMVDPITGKGCFYNPKTGERWSRPNVKKIMDPQGRTLNYNQTHSPQAGPHWFERMAFDHKDEIGEGAAKIAGGKYKK